MVIPPTPTIILVKKAYLDLLGVMWYNEKAATRELVISRRSMPFEIRYHLPGIK